MRKPRQIINYGRKAVLLEWEQKIDKEINAAVHAYALAIGKIDGVLESVPSYCTLLVTLDLKRLSIDKLKEKLFDLSPVLSTRKGRLHRLPVCYGGEFGPDLEMVCEKLNISPADLIKLHSNHTYWVYQLGYQPGFGFLGETPPKLHIERKASPRSYVAAGSVGLAGRQTGIYPSDGPGGWQLVGRCPWPLLRDKPAPFVRLKAGDQVQFFSIEPGEWEAYSTKPELWTA